MDGGCWFNRKWQHIGKLFILYVLIFKSIVKTPDALSHFDHKPKGHQQLGLIQKDSWKFILQSFSVAIQKGMSQTVPLDWDPDWLFLYSWDILVNSDFWCLVRAVRKEQILSMKVYEVHEVNELIMTASNTSKRSRILSGEWERGSDTGLLLMTGGATEWEEIRQGGAKFSKGWVSNNNIHACSESARFLSYRIYILKEFTMGVVKLIQGQSSSFDIIKLKQ